MSYALLEKMPNALRYLYAFGVLNDLDIYLTEMLQRRFKKNNPSDAALLACALTNRVVGEGHVCLDLRKITPTWLIALAPGDALDQSSLLPELVALCSQLAAMTAVDLMAEGGGLIGEAGSNHPIIIRGSLLYLRRYWNYESYISARLENMSAAAESVGNPADLDKKLDGLALDGRQRDAAVAAMHRKLTVISGGPGTGKTYTAARILHLLLHTGAAAGRVPVIRMAAPTGKAAARLDESVRDALSQIDSGAKEPNLFFEPACTIERLLGFKRDSPYFKYNKESPLPAAIVLIDEASMIDLPKMAKLLGALDDNCRLVLLGDMHQLASVAPGSVMADICSSELLQESVVELTLSRRFPEGSPVHQLGQAVNRAVAPKGGGYAWELLEKLNNTLFKAGEGKPQSRIRRFNVDGPFADYAGHANLNLAAAVIEGYRDFMAAKDVPQAFKALAEFRILCALRRGPHGVNRVNQLVEEILSGKAVKRGDLPETLQKWERLHPAGEFYDHRVIMITCNDYSLGLFNGDLGIVMPDDIDPTKMVAWFESSVQDDPPRKVQCRLLPGHETAFCTTIHKAQGSEFGHVLIILPQKRSQILTKELIYTAITRSKGSVDLWVNQDVFEEAVERTVERSSGLLSNSE